MDTAPPRSREQRKTDTLTRFEQGEDAWVASADADGEAYITPLSYVWDGATFVMATVESGLTGRNLAARDRVRFAIGETRNVHPGDGPDRSGRRLRGQAVGRPAGPEAAGVLPHHAATDPGLAGGQRADRPTAHARRRVARVIMAAPRAVPRRV